MNIDNNESLESYVKDVLNISDYRQLSKKKVLQLVSTLSKTDPEVAKEALKQFPSLSNNLTSITNTISDFTSNLIEEDGSATIEAANKILDNLIEISNNPDLSRDDINYIIDRQIEVASIIQSVEDEKRLLKKTGLQTVAAFGALALGLLGAVLGVNITRDNGPF